MRKDKIIELLNEMPEEFSLDEFMEQLRFMENINQGLLDMENGNTRSNEFVHERVSQWFKSNGPKKQN